MYTKSRRLKRALFHKKVNQASRQTEAFTGQMFDLNIEGERGFQALLPGWWGAGVGLMSAKSLVMEKMAGRFVILLRESVIKYIFKTITRLKRHSSVIKGDNFFRKNLAPAQ